MFDSIHSLLTYGIGTYSDTTKYAQVCIKKDHCTLHCSISWAFPRLKLYPLKLLSDFRKWSITTFWRIRKLPKKIQCCRNHKNKKNWVHSCPVFDWLTFLRYRTQICIVTNNACYVHSINCREKCSKLQFCSKLCDLFNRKSWTLLPWILLPWIRPIWSPPFWSPFWNPFQMKTNTNITACTRGESLEI